VLATTAQPNTMIEPIQMAFEFRLTAGFECHAAEISANKNDAINKTTTQAPPATMFGMLEGFVAQNRWPSELAEIAADTIKSSPCENRRTSDMP